MTKENPSGVPNLEIWTTEGVAEFVQKKHQDWYVLVTLHHSDYAHVPHTVRCRCPQWSDDENLCARNVTNEVHCFEGGAPGYTFIKYRSPCSEEVGHDLLTCTEHTLIICCISITHVNS